MTEEIQKLKEKYQGEWLAVRTEEISEKGKLIAHNKDRRALHKELREKEIKGVYVTYAGPFVKPGYVEGLLGLSFLDKIKTVIDYKKGILELEK